MTQNKSNKWLYIYTIIGIAFILGTIGYIIHFNRNHIVFNVPDLLYAIIKLFFLETGKLYIMEGDYEPQQINIFLNIARFLAPISIATAIINTILQAFSEKIKMAKTSQLKNHIILWGNHETFAPLVEDLIAQKIHVVWVTEVDTKNKYDNENRYLYVLPNTRYRNTSAFLRKVNFYKCRYLLIANQDDEKTLTFTGEMVNHIRLEKLKQQVKMVLQFDEIRWAEITNDLGILEDKVVEVMKKSLLDIKYLQINRRTTRKLFIDHAPDIYFSNRPVHSGKNVLFLSGDSNYVMEMLFQLAIICHYPGDVTTEILLDSEPSQEMDEFIEDHQLNEMPGIQVHYKKIKKINQAVDVVYINYEYLIDTLKTIKQVKNTEAFQHAGIVVCKNSRENPEEMIPYKDVRIFDKFKETGTFSCLIDERTDKLAEIIHQKYLEEVKSRNKLDPKRPTHREWKELPSEVKDRNRFQADHIWVKIRSIGCKAIPSENGQTGYDISQDPNFEALSAAEHNRWWAYMNYKGWKRSEQRNDAMKLHTDLVPFEELSEETRQYDRDAVANIPELLKHLGLTLVKDKQNKYNRKA